MLWLDALQVHIVSRKDLRCGVLEVLWHFFKKNQTCHMFVAKNLFFEKMPHECGKKLVAKIFVTEFLPHRQSTALGRHKCTYDLSW